MCKKIHNGGIVMSDLFYDLFDCLSETEKKQGKLKGMVSAAIENKRYKLNMTQKQFAEMMGITQGMVSKLESAEYNISMDKLIEIFEKLDIEYKIDVAGKTCVSNSYAEHKGISYSYLMMSSASNNKFEFKNCTLKSA